MFATETESPLLRKDLFESGILGYSSHYIVLVNYWSGG